MDFTEKKILITGHTGFKGSWLTLWLIKLGAEVIGYSLEPPTKPSLFDVLNLKERIVHIIGDIRDEKKLKDVFKNYEPEIVFHLAAQPLVRVSYKEPKLTYETNVIGTLNLLEAVRETQSIRVVIVVTSDKCYENKEWFYGYREIDPLGGYDPYSASKACVEILVSSYRSSFFNPESYGKTHQTSVATVRAGNVIGGGDWQVDRLIPDCVKALSKGESIKIRNPNAIRPWQHVLEPLSGYLFLAQKMWEEPTKYCEAWNFGPFEKDLATVREVVEKVISLWGGGKYEVERDTRFHEAGLLRLDISKAMMKLGWRPKWDLDMALERTIKWYKLFYKGRKDMLGYSLQEIKDYEEI
ncbi:MAG: Nucleoside-diphosphate-sugar epimerase [Thermodesulfobacterium sp.]|uniref:Nucleoside-diphosphate-sugar epimerase n=1 Tax=Candidatus Thermodesulfobacterium syntrophicum TaxID=3060442 RepID=A0AAE3P651_9BACT|nr:Nucleoside-diphosphate-sugar epimerase [Candidatus Thermodesulfobacterium syntrophicum]